MQQYSCDYCGLTNFDYPSVIAESELNFCDKECHRLWQKHERPPEGHNWYKGGPVTVKCSWCNDELERKPSIVERNENFYCGKACQGKHKSQLIRGENHPRWKGGVKIWYGPNWREQRSKRLEYDNNKCVVCGMSSGEHKEIHGCDLHVHHIQPARDFLVDGHVIDDERANRLENLITLCYKCHGRYEGVPIDNEVNYE